MKVKRIFFAAVIALYAEFAAAIVPEVDFMPNWYSIDEVKTGRQSTIIDVTFFNEPGRWVMLASNTFLRDRATGTEYKLVKADGIALDEKVDMDKTGKLAAKLYFEPLPKSVKTVDLIEVGSKDNRQTYGMHLDRKRQPSQPKPRLTVEDVLNRDGEPSEWTPPVGERFIDEDFVIPDGNVHFIGKIDNYVPEIGSTIAQFHSDNEVSGKDAVVIAQLDSIGNFTVDIPLSHAREIWFELGESYWRAFVFPGDTVRYNATTRKPLIVSPDGKVTREYEYEIIDCNNPATVEINLLKDVLADSLRDLRVEWGEYYPVASQGYDNVMAFGEKIKENTREAVTRLTRLLTPLNISPKAKDVLFTTLLVDINVPMMEVLMNYGMQKTIVEVDKDGRRVGNPNPDYVKPDLKKYFGGQEDYIAYLWGNPYVMSSGGSYINRLEYETDKSMINIIVTNFSGKIIMSDLSVFNMDKELSNKTRYSWLENYLKDQEDAYGSGNDFMSQLFITKRMLSAIRSAQNDSESLKSVAALGADVMRLVKYKTLQDYYHTALCDLAKKVAINEMGPVGNETSRMIEDKSKVLASIIAPYKGRVIYVDVWDAYCGPCRAGIINQKKILEEFMDEPVTVIYIAPESDREPCEKFMEENDIKGEHVFLSNDDDARLKADFDIQSIPFAILIKKNGEFTTEISYNLDSVFKKALEE